MTGHAPTTAARITAAMCAAGRPIAEPRISPDETTVAFISNGLVLVPVDGGPEAVVPTDPPVVGVAAYGGGAFDWAGDELVYSGRDGNLYVVAAAGGPARPLLYPPGAGPASSPIASPDGKRVAYLIDQHHVAVAPVDGSAWPAKLSTTADFAFDPAWSPDGTHVAWHEWDVPFMPWDESRIVIAPADASAPPTTVHGGNGVSVSQPRWSPDGSALAFLSDADGWLNLWLADGDGANPRPLLKEAFEHGGPSWGPGQRSFVWSPDRRRIAFTRNEGGFGRLCILDLETSAITDVGKGGHGGLCWHGDNLVAVRSGAKTPTQLVTYAPDRRTLARGPVVGFEPALVEPEIVQWQGDDGGEVYGRLYSPGGEAPPLLVYCHGGPTGQTPVDFVPRIAFYVAHGWAVLVPDYRGSTGWGRAYAQALQGRWGELDVADCAAGMRAAAERGWGDARRMVPIGGSAGGFTVLLLLALHPELCAAGVDLFGVADLLDLDETTHRFEQHYLHGIVGPLPETADRYRERSPVNLAERITSPLLILQGTDDPAVPVKQSKTIAEKLERLGRTVEIHLYEGEGHGWSKPDVVKDELERTDDFLRRHVLRWRA